MLNEKSHSNWIIEDDWKRVLLECLDNNHIEEVLVINRQPTTINHPKLKEVIHQDFLEFESIKGALHGFDACIHCMECFGNGNERK